jgi:putative transposase
MPDHVHLLLTPSDGITLEKGMQLIKGGFSFRAGKLISRIELWERSLANHRVRDPEDYAAHRNYILQNPVRRGLSESPEAYRWCSAVRGLVLDPPPQGLKPLSFETTGPQG